MSESQGYADAPRNSADPNQVTCKTCWATVYVGVKKEHVEWHRQLVEQQQAVAIEVTTEALKVMNQRATYNP